MSEHIAIMVVLTTLICSAAFVLKTAFDTLRRNRAEKHRADIMNKMLEKFHNGEELTRYLESDGGREFLRSGAPEPRANPFSRVINSVQGGIVAVALSTGLLVLRSFIQDYGGREGLLIFGTVGFAIGAGLLLSAASAYVLSRKFGLFNGNQGK